MSQAAEDKQFGKLLVSAGKISSEQLLAALGRQQQLGGPQRKRLGEILVEQGHLSVDEIQATLVQQGKQMLWCPRCRVQVNIEGAAPGTPYACQQCRGELRPAPAPRSTAASETWPAIPVPSGSNTKMGEEVRRALDDPSRRIDRYVVLSELGRGGMGVVYRCYDPHLHRNVAIKMILDATGTENIARFKREARAAAKIQHPGIVALHEVGEHEGCPYLVMDFVEGETFDALLRRKKPSVRRIAMIVRGVALALHHAHTAKIIHRDIKPQNVMVDAQGKPHIMDFGLARDISASQQLTKHGQIVGTPAYMAPEQADSHLGEHGPWTDVYGLGAMIYRALAGQPVFKAATPAALLRKVLADEPLPLRQLDPSIELDLETITLRCLEKEPARRYQSAAAVAEELQRFLQGHPILARPIGRSEKAARWARRNRALSAALALVVVVLVGSLLGGFAMYRKHQEDLVQERIQATITKEQATQEAKTEATILERLRASNAALEDLRLEVLEVLDRARIGKALLTSSDREIAKAAILKHRQAETARLLAAELDALSGYLAEDSKLSASQERFLHFLCEMLSSLEIRDDAVASLGQYLRAELALQPNARDQLRAVRAAEALCLLGGEEADRLLLEAKRGFGLLSPFWEKVQPLYGRTGVEPALLTETAIGFTRRGLARIDKGNFEGALADFSRAIEMDPSHAPAWHNRGVARYKTGALDDAIADCSRAIELDPNNPKTWVNRGNARNDMGDRQGARDDYNRAIEVDPSYAPVWQSRGVIRFAAGDLDGAMADYSRAIEIDPRFAAAWYRRGITRSQKGDSDGAISDYSRAIEIDPDHAEALFRRGIKRMNKGDYDGAIADQTRAIEINPNKINAWVNRGTARINRGDLDLSIADFTHVLEIDPTNAIALRNRGESLRLQGNLDKAIADLSRAIELAPSDTLAWTKRGNARMDKGDLDGAIADLNRAIEIDPRYVPAWLNRGICWFQAGDLDAAAADYSHARDIDPNEAQAWFNLGTVQERKGDLDSAIAHYSRAIEINPSYASALNNRGTARMSKGDLDGAIADLSRAIELAPQKANYWGNRGNAQLKLGDLNQAFTDYSRAIKVDPTFAPAWKHRGVARLSGGDVDGALADWQHFLDLVPNNPDAPEIQKAVQQLRQQKADSGSGGGN